MDAIDELASAITRIQRLLDTSEYGEIGKAERLPYTWKRRVEAISISARDGTWAREAKPEDIEVAKAIRAELVDRYEARGRMERDEAIKAIVSEVEALRAVIVSLAGKASIEAGQRSRALAAE